MNDDFDLHYSLNAEINRIFFYTDYNTLNILVEDKDKEFEYENIFNRMFNGELTFETIFAVGGKLNLKEAYKLLKESKDEIDSINVFVTDRDFDFILDKEVINDEIFLYLDQYCIENYFIDSNAIINFIQGRVCKRLAEVKRQVNLEFWHSTITKQFYNLFILFLIVQDKKLPIPNVGESTFKFIKNTSWEIDEDKFNAYYTKVSEYVVNLDQEILAMQNRLKKKVGNDIHTVISGKFYFDSLKMYLLNFSSSKINDKDLRNYLVKNFNIRKLDFIKNSIIELKNKSVAAS